MNNALKIIMTVLFGLGLVFSVSAAMDDNSIAKRLKSVANVCVEGEDCGTAAAVVASGPRDGADIYQSSCLACHSAGVMGAPKVGDTAAWNDLLAKGFDTVVANAINGINAMPPRGTCASCSDDEIRATVQYMIDNSK